MSLSLAGRASLAIKNILQFSSLGDILCEVLYFGQYCQAKQVSVAKKSGLLIRILLFHFIFFYIILMRKVLAVASVGIEHKELVFKDLKNIFKRIKISIDTLLQQELIHPNSSILDSSSVFKSYPYITLTIPNYEAHREYLQKIYKNNVLFNKFILLISKGDTYEQLVINRNQEILKEHCRNWNTVVNCTFDSTPVFTQIEQQVSKINKVLGEMDIRGKVSAIDAKKKFHLIEDHVNLHLGPDDPLPQEPRMPNKVNLLKLFFGLEVGCGRRGSGNADDAASYIANNSFYSMEEEFKEFQEDKMMNEDTQDIDNLIQHKKIINVGRWNNRRVNPESEAVKMRAVKRLAKRRLEQNLAPSSCSNKNPYLKKKYVDEIVLSQEQNNS